MRRIAAQQVPHRGAPGWAAPRQHQAQRRARRQGRQRTAAQAGGRAPCRVRQPFRIRVRQVRPARPQAREVAQRMAVDQHGFPW